MTANESTLNIYQDGTQLWVKNGILHNENGPAVIRANGDRGWYLNGKLYRVAGPDDGGDDRYLKKKIPNICFSNGGDE